MKINTIIITFVILLVGIFVGYQISESKPQKLKAIENNSGAHMMPDGQMMGGNGNIDMDDMMNVMNAELKGKTGDTFDQAFISGMIVHHQGAVEMAQLALVNAKHQEIKNLAREILLAQNKEIADMKMWQKGWYNK